MSEIDAVLIQDKIPRPDSDPDGEKDDYVHLGGDGKNECNISQSAKKGTAQTLILTCDEKWSHIDIPLYRATF